MKRSPIKRKPLARKCRICKNPFNTTDLRRWWCCVDCGYKYAVQARKKQKEKDWRERKKVLQQGLKTLSDYEKEAQQVFNKFIRLRDEGKECISCDTLLQKGLKYDAGHCYSVGHYRSLRFNEDNVHGQCVLCNQHKHGNQAEYILKLPDRIGKEAANKLTSVRHETNKLNKGDVKKLVEYYKNKLADLG